MSKGERKGDAKAAAPAPSATTNTGSHAPPAIGGVLEPTVSAIVILDSDGNRLLAKYFTKDVRLAELKQQLSFERKVFEKTQKSNARSDADVLIFDTLLCVYKFRADVLMYVFGPQEENELVVLSALNSIDESLCDLLRKDPAGVFNKKALLENLDLAIIAIDEIIDDGMVFEMDSFEVAARVAQVGVKSEVPLSEQTFSQVVASAKDQLVRSFAS